MYEENSAEFLKEISDRKFVYHKEISPLITTIVDEIKAKNPLLLKIKGMNEKKLNELSNKMNEFEKSLYFLEKALKKEPDNKMINCNILEVKKKLQNSNDVDIYIEKCNMD